MKNLYELLDEMVYIITNKYISNYSLENIYKGIVYIFTQAALQKKSINRLELLKHLESKIPSPLLISMKEKLWNTASSILNHIESIIEAKKSVVDSEANLMHIVNSIKYAVRNVNTILIYDCMSLIEQIVISAFLRSKGLKSFFLRDFLINPRGLTSYITEQIPNVKLGEVAMLSNLANLLSKELGAIVYKKDSYIDLKVHEKGLIGLDEFLNSISITYIANNVLKSIYRGGSMLLISDHGYDIVLSYDKQYIYVVHGFKYVNSFDIPLLLLSRLAFFVYGISYQLR